MELTTSTPRPVHWGLLSATALLITLLLYFIDEGRYSLSGLATSGNLLVMGIYLLGMLVGLHLLAHLFAKRHPTPMRTVLVLVLGALAGFVIGLILVAGLGALQHLG